MINPTVGRIVWYRPDEADKKGGAEPPMQTCGDQPLAAQIVAVHGPRCVSVALYDAAGRHFARTSVTLVQDDDKIPSNRYVEWMPYQRERTAAASIDNTARNVLSTTAAASISHGDYQTEIAIQMAGSTAPRIKPEDVLAAIDSETYTITPSGRTTICELTLTNGFTVRGESSCVSMDNFDEAIGRTEARKKAIDKVWELEGYRLMQKLYEQRNVHPVQQIADAIGGRVEGMLVRPDGSGSAVVSSPLPKDHWLYADGFDEPPMGLRTGTTSPEREELADKVRAAARYAVRGATMNGKVDDFDPDALVQNMVVGLLGYFTPDGLSRMDNVEEPTGDPTYDAMAGEPVRDQQ